MKRIDYILIGLLAISSLTACTEKKKSNIIIAPKPVAKVVNKATQKMSDYEQTRDCLLYTSDAADEIYSV